MSKRSGPLRLLALALIVAAAPACGNASSPGTTSGSTNPRGSATTYGGQDFTRHVAVEAPGVTGDEIRVGSITARTNPVGGDNGIFDEGVKAYLDVVNAHGGVWGRQIRLTSERDDQTAANLNETEAMLAGDDVYAVFESVLLFSGSKRLAAAGIPTFGWNANPEWTGPSNFFPNIGPICFSKACSSIGKVLPWIAQQEGAHRVALIGYGVAQSADSVTSSAAEIRKFAKQTGVDVVYEDPTLQFGQLDYAPQVAEMKAKHADFLVTGLDFNGDFAVAKEMRRQGILGTVKFFHPNLYNAKFVHDNAALFEGGIVMAGVLASEHAPPPPALQEYLDAMRARGKAVTEMTEQGWIAARQFVAALRAAGPDFTWAHLIAAWNQQTRYTNGGLVPPIDWTREHADPAAGVAHRSPFECRNFLRIHDGKFVGIYDDDGQRPWLCFHGQQPDTWEQPAHLSLVDPPVGFAAASP